MLAVACMKGSGAVALALSGFIMFIIRLSLP